MLVIGDEGLGFKDSDINMRYLISGGSMVIFLLIVSKIIVQII